MKLFSYLCTALLLQGQNVFAEKPVSGNGEQPQTSINDAKVANPAVPNLVVDHHLMKSLGAGRYAPTLKLRLDSCEGCYLVRDEVIRWKNGKVEKFPGIRNNTVGKLNISRENAGLVSIDVTYVSPNVRTMCFHNFKICRSIAPPSCVPLDARVYYEWDLTNGNVSTTLPAKSADLIKSEEYKPELCGAPLLS